MITKKQLQNIIIKEVRSVLKEQEQLALPGIGDTDRKIVSYYATWTPEDVEHGEASDRGEEGEYEIELDKYDREEGKTVVDLAVEYLKDNYAYEPSSSHFHSGVWYASSDENPYTGEREEKTYHLKGFTKDEEEAIFDEMKR